MGVFMQINDAYNNLAKKLDGKMCASILEEFIKKDVENGSAMFGSCPRVATIYNPKDDSSKKYVKMKINACARVGINTLEIPLSENATTSDIVSLVEKLNANEEISGILIQHPLQYGIDEKKCVQALSPQKDIDGLNSDAFGYNFFRLNKENCNFVNWLKTNEIDVEGKNVGILCEDVNLCKTLTGVLLSLDATVSILQNEWDFAVETLFDVKNNQIFHNKTKFLCNFYGICEKDVKNYTSITQSIYKSATPKGIITLLKHNGIDLKGKSIVIVGRSDILGRPLAELCLENGADVTICHSKTQNLQACVERADIVVGAVGKKHLIKSSWLKNGSVLVDAGCNVERVWSGELCKYVDKIYGDIEKPNEEDLKRLGAYTPIIGGVGPMTIASLLENVSDAFLKNKNNENENEKILTLKKN